MCVCLEDNFSYIHHLEIKETSSLNEELTTTFAEDDCIIISSSQVVCSANTSLHKTLKGNRACVCLT